MFRYLVNGRAREPYGFRHVQLSRRKSTLKKMRYALLNPLASLRKTSVTRSPRIMRARPDPYRVFTVFATNAPGLFFRQVKL